MNKKIIAIAIASAMAAPVAMADMKVSGQLGAALTFSDKNTNAGTDAASSREFGDEGLTKVVFDGTAGNAFARMGIDTRSIANGKGAGALVNGRAFYAGYKLSGMSVSFGRMGAALAGLEGDKYNATFLQSRRTAAVATTNNTTTDSFTASMVIQLAGKAGGMAYKVQYDPADNTDTSGGEGHFAVSVKGKAGSVGYFAGYNNGHGTENAAQATVYNGDGTVKTAAVAATSNSDSNMKVGASMGFGKVKATLMYMASDNDGTKNNATTILADMNMGNGMNAGIGYGTNKAKDTWTRVAMTKSLNKGAKIFGGATIKDPKGSSAATVFGVGMAVKF